VCVVRQLRVKYWTVDTL